jgi:hypothetical protein
MSALVLIILWASLSLASTFEKGTVVVPSSLASATMYGRYETVTMFIGPLCLCPASLSLFYLSLTWLVIASQSSALKRLRLGSFERVNQIVSFQQLILFVIFVICWATVLTSWSDTNVRFVISFVSIPLCFILVGMVRLGSIYLRHLLLCHAMEHPKNFAHLFSNWDSAEFEIRNRQSIMNEGGAYETPLLTMPWKERVAKLILQTDVSICIVSFLGMVGMVGFVVLELMFGWRDSPIVNGYSIQVVMFMLGPICLSLTQVLILVYFHRTLNRSSRLRSYCRVFRRLHHRFASIITLDPYPSTDNPNIRLPSIKEELETHPNFVSSISAAT